MHVQGGLGGLLLRLRADGHSQVRLAGPAGQFVVRCVLSPHVCMHGVMSANWTAQELPAQLRMLCALTVRCEGGSTRSETLHPMAASYCPGVRVRYS